MLKDRRMRIAWKAYLAELGVIQMLERPSQAVIAERVREYFRLRFIEALEALPHDSSVLAEVLSEMLVLVIGQEEIENWRPPAVTETLARLTEPLSTHATQR